MSRIKICGLRRPEDIAAVNEAMRKAEAEAAQNMSKLTGGLNLGGLF